MKIILVEDDYLQAERVSNGLAKEFGGSVQVIESEVEFRRRRREFEANPPDIFVIDMWLRWTSPEPGMTLPPKDAADRQGGGLRCWRLLEQSAATRDVPVVFYSMLPEEDHVARLGPLPSTAAFLVKETARDSDRLLYAEIRRLTARRAAGEAPA